MWLGGKAAASPEQDRSAGVSDERSAGDGRADACTVSAGDQYILTSKSAAYACSPFEWLNADNSDLPSNLALHPFPIYSSPCTVTTSQQVKLPASVSDPPYKEAHT